MRVPGASVVAVLLLAQAPTACPPAPSPAPAAVAGLSIEGNPGVLTLIGQQVQLSATFRLTDGTTRDATSLAVWSSSDSSVAVSYRAGTVAILGYGSADIHASYSGVAATTTLTIEPPEPPEWIYLGAVYTDRTDTTVSTLLVDPRDDRLLYVVTDHGLFVSRDQGATWTAGPQPRSTDPWGAAVAHLAGDPRNADRVFFARGQTLWLSEDRGATWRAVFDIPTVEAGSRYISSLLVSALDGTIWVTTTRPVNQGFATSGFGVHRSTDGGVSWTFTAVDDRFLIVWEPAEDPVDGTLYWVAEIADHPQPYDPPWYRSVDRGRSWEAMTKAVNWHATSTIVDPASEDVYVLSEGPGPFRSTDHGASWEHLSSVNFVGTLRLDPTRQGRLYVGTATVLSQSGGVWMSTDKGHSFAALGLQGRSCVFVALNGPGTALFASCYESGLWMARLP